MTKSEKPYHHGDLKQALINAAEHILETEGLSALTLRAAARAVGVSHTAPQNHFGDLTGLLSEVAAGGHRKLSAAMSEAVNNAGGDARAKRLAMGRAYLAFAKAHPSLFTLMFRGEKLDATRPALHDALVAQRQAMREGLVQAMNTGNSSEPADIAAKAVAGWALVHGYVMLLMEGRLRGTLAALPDQDAESFFERVLNSMTMA